jgi:hypothetical protein
MLSLIEFALIPIPLVFYRYGHKIREKSTLIRQMREDREKLDGKKQRAAERAAVVVVVGAQREEKEGEEEEEEEEEKRGREIAEKKALDV